MFKTMIRSSFFLLAILFAFVCEAQKKVNTDLNMPLIRGRVKTLIEYSDTNYDVPAKSKTGKIYKHQYYYNKEGKCDSMINYSTKESRMIRFFTYNEKGWKIKDESNKGVIYEYYYDTIGNLIKGTTTLPGKVKNIQWYDENGNIVRMDDYSFDSLLLKKIKWPSMDSPSIQKYINRYNKKGLVFEALIYQDGKLARKEKYTYDEKDNRIESSTFDSAGVFMHKEQNRFDIENRHNEWIWYDKNGNTTIHQSVRYDKYGNIKENIWYKKDGSISSDQVFHFKYDKQGNWIERTFTSKNGNERKEFRIIEYY